MTHGRMVLIYCLVKTTVSYMHIYSLIIFLLLKAVFLWRKIIYLELASWTQFRSQFRWPHALVFLIFLRILHLIHLPISFVLFSMFYERHIFYSNNRQAIS
jgi:hypothetical protein